MFWVAAQLALGIAGLVSGLGLLLLVFAFFRPLVLALVVAVGVLLIVDNLREIWS